MRCNLRSILVFVFGAALWLSTEQHASAQVLLAQSGVAKTMLGWLLTLLAITLGIIVVCRPSSRRSLDKK
jgi:hypothetical protein